MRPAALAGLLVIGAAGYAAWRRARAGETWESVDIAPPSLGETWSAITGAIMPSRWSEDKIPPEYLPAIRAAESANALPRNLLARLLWQESRYRPRAVSPAGAQGIAQFMPETAREFGIDPLDPAQAIPAAGRYLRQLHNRFGDWTAALAAYNWGMGNVARKGLARAPAETRRYYTDILGDIGYA